MVIMNNNLDRLIAQYNIHVPGMVTVLKLRICSFSSNKCPDSQFGCMSLMKRMKRFPLECYSDSNVTHFIKYIRGAIFVETVTNYTR